MAEPDYHLPTRVCLSQSEDGPEPGTLLEVYHTNVVLEALIVDCPVEAIVQLLPRDLLLIRAPPAFRILRPREGASFPAGTDPALLKTLDEALVEASRRCTIRAAPAEQVQSWHGTRSDQLLHPPDRVCVDFEPGHEHRRCVIFVRHTNVSVTMPLQHPLATVVAVLSATDLSIHLHDGINNDVEDRDALGPLKATAAMIEAAKQRAEPYRRKHAQEDEAKLSGAGAARAGEGKTNGATASAVASAVVTTGTACCDEKEEEPRDMCVVCHCNMADGDKVTTFGCPAKHRFHLACLLEWLKQRASCPLCRFDLRTVGDVAAEAAASAVARVVVAADEADEVDEAAGRLPSERMQELYDAKIDEPDGAPLDKAGGAAGVGAAGVGFDRLRQGGGGGAQEVGPASSSSMMAAAAAAAAVVIDSGPGAAGGIVPGAFAGMDCLSVAAAGSQVAAEASGGPPLGDGASSGQATMPTAATNATNAANAANAATP